MAEVKMGAPTPREEATLAALRRRKIDISADLLSQLCYSVQYIASFTVSFPNHTTNCNGMACSAQYFARRRALGVELDYNQLIINQF